MQIISGKIQSAQRAVIYGPEGIGKSTFASKFPDPLFIDTEGSTKQLDVSRTPAPTSWAMIISQVEYVKANPDVCKTLVIDTADWAEQLCIRSICAEYKKTGIEDFGYGKGYVYLAEEFGRLLNLLNDAIDRGIHVVFTAHAQMRKFEQPDEAGAYDRWELKLQKKTAPLLKEWADMVLFANYKTYVINVDGQGAEKGRNKAQGGKRVMYTTHHPAWDAKNRHDLPEELDLDYAAIAHIFNSLAPAPQTATSTTVPAQVVEPTPAPIPQSGPMPAETEPPTLGYRESLEAAGVPVALIDLMESSGVMLDELQAVVAAKGYFPLDTPFINYPPDFVDGVLIAAWPQVLAEIEQSRLDTAPFK